MEKIMNCPIDKCPLDLLAELGERTKDCKIYLDQKALEKLQESCSKSVSTDSRLLSMFWAASRTYPSTELLVSKEKTKDGYFEILYIKADDIAFEEPSCNPKEIFKIKMAA